MSRSFHLFAFALVMSLLTLFGCAPSKVNDDQIEVVADEGLAALRIFDFTSAYKSLSRIQPELPQTNPRWEEITFAYAISCWHATPPDPEKTKIAVDLFREILNSDANDGYKTLSTMALARIKEVSSSDGDGVTDLEQARALYESVQKEHPTGKAGYQASLRLAQSYVQLLTPESIQQGLVIIAAQIEKDPVDPWAAVAYQYSGDLYAYYLNDISTALDCYLKADEIGMANASRADVYLWGMSMWAAQLSKDALAVKLWQRIINDHPRSIYGTMARDHLKDYASSHPDEAVEIPVIKTW
ncbi:tetratricopeptide repeat protein [Cerasicoccus arenae]|uniref:Tetratricopeptide repeat protein n=1 Tax=Cerasicoccus arenae TaxID=424488 RepID=A0A8J3DHZ2_9BACT|nr:hypothetical protein [Cerasicoccus arenae]MBK1859871.1 hypothetical protein [Cerasicoccus arenae]GHC01365.1 hypothetical protein GCM10007047_17280 [Cerasicoccus arenae]